MSMTIGIDPHKASHTAVVIDGHEHPVARLTVTADRVRRLAALRSSDVNWVALYWVEAANAVGGRPRTSVTPARTSSTALRVSASLSGQRWP